MKLLAVDGKMRLTDVADTEQLLQLIQSIPSPKAEPFKVWLAKVGYERIEEVEDPEKASDRAMETYLKKEYSKNWINQRLKSIEVRKELTDEWDLRGVKKGLGYAILTNEITKAWSGFNIREYKKFKGLKKENLRDNMTNLELVFNMPAEATTKEISKEKKPKIYRKQSNCETRWNYCWKYKKRNRRENRQKVTSSLNANELGKKDSDEIKSIEE